MFSRLHTIRTIALFVMVSGVLCIPMKRINAGERRTPASPEKLVTGDNARLSDVVTATTPTLKFYFTPRPPLPGTEPSLPYPAGYVISGQKLTVSRGGFTSAWIGQIEGWDPDGDGQPLLRSFQEKLDSFAYWGSNASPPNPGCDLVYPANASFACQKTCVGGLDNGANCAGAADCRKACVGGTNNGNACNINTQCPGGGTCVGACGDPCASIMGEAGPLCGGTSAGVCDWVWQDLTNPNWVFASVPGHFTPAASGTSPTGAIFAGTADVGGWEIFDEGRRYYIGTIILPVPACCKGTYTMGIKQGTPGVPETFALDQATPANDIPIAALIAGQLECQVGSCCTTTQCIDYLTAAECTSAGGGFYLGSSCMNPPTTDGCCQCISNLDCEPLGDQCMQGVCVHQGSACYCTLHPKAGWNPSTQCCDASTGMVANKAATDGPCVRGCSLPDSRGIPQVVFAPSGTTCANAGDCLVNEQCNGAGQCVGTPSPAGAPCSLNDPCYVNDYCDASGRCLPGTQNPGANCLKNRFIAFQPVAIAGNDISSLRVRLVSLQRPQPSNVALFPPQDFSAYEGQVRWVGPIQDCIESESPPSSFKCAFLQCTPWWEPNWFTPLAGGWLQVTGPEIMPSSFYTVEQLKHSCLGNEDTCADFAMTISIDTARFGDCVPPYQDPSPSMEVTQPNISDVSAVVDKFKTTSTAISRLRAQLQPNAIGAGQAVSISDVSAAVDAFAKRAYLQAGPQACP